MPKVMVLMSTYNGEKYLKMQLDSVLNQEGVDVQILVRDDGSTDGTLDILQEYAKQGKLTYYTGPNLKPAKSFMDLIRKASQADYYAFADQDDYWLPGKLARAVEKLGSFSDPQRPSLYYSRTILVDKDLKPYPDNLQKYRKFLTFTQSVISSQATGCTFVFNAALVHLARQYKPEFQLMHDAWLFLICLGVGGNVFFDEQSFIYYRQHENNVIGGRASFYATYKRRFNNLLHHNCVRSKSIAELVKGYANKISTENLTICTKLLDYKKGWKAKWAIIKDKNIRTGDKEIDRIFILSILLECF